jgi:hypothetical protein
MTDDIEFFFEDSDHRLGSVESSVRLQQGDVVKIFTADIPQQLQRQIGHNPHTDAFRVFKVASVTLSARTGRIVQEVELRTL